MRFIGHDVEYYVLGRSLASVDAIDIITSPGPPSQHPNVELSLHDSLWIFDGVEVKVWPDVHDLILSAAADTGRDLPEPVGIPVDFYPLSPLLQKGILFGIEGELVQRRDNFTSFRTVDRVRVHV